MLVNPDKMGITFIKIFSIELSVLFVIFILLYFM